MNQVDNAHLRKDGSRSQGAYCLNALALLPEKTILDEAFLANVLSVSPRTIRRMVGRGELPAPVPFAGRSVWFAGRVLNFLERKMEKAEAARERRVAAAARQTT